MRRDADHPEALGWKFSGAKKATAGDAGPPRDETPGAEATPWSKPEEARLRDALTAIPADDYDTWLKVGMALHWLGRLGKGRTIWDEWSAKSAKFDPENQTAKWASFNATQGAALTIASVYKLAKECGWSPKAKAAASGADWAKMARDIETAGANAVDVLCAAIAAIPSKDRDAVEEERLTLIAIEQSKKAGAKITKAAIKKRSGSRPSGR